MRFLGLGLRSKHFSHNGGKYIFAYNWGKHFTAMGEGKQVGFDDNFDRTRNCTNATFLRPKKANPP